MAKKQGLVRQYILVGGGLGLYFGYFFRPLRDPNFAVAVAMALLATAVLTTISLLRKNRPPFEEIGKTAVTTFLKFAIILALLEVRHYVYDFGGRWLVVVVTTLLGAIGGWWMAQSDMQKSGQKR